LDGFTGALCRERSLATTTVENDLNQVRHLVAWYAQQCQTTLAALTIGDGMSQRLPH
jgi:hypothetical protein